METPRSPDVQMAWEVVRAAPSPLALTDACGVVRRVNQAFCSLTGRDQDEVVGTRIGCFLDPEDMAEDQALVRRLLAGELDGDRLDQRYRRADGAVVPVRCEVWVARPCGDGDRGDLHVLRLLRPLDADADAATTNAAAVVASSGDAITGFSIDGTIIHWNPAAERLYGLRAADTVGRPIWEALPSEWASDVAKILERVARGERIADYKTSRPRLDATRVEVTLTVAPMADEGDRVVGASVVARDITQRKRAESLLAGQARILEMIAATADLGHILDALAELIEAHASSARCSILLLESGGLHHGGGLELPAIENLVGELAGAPGGPYGTAALIVADLATDPRCHACRHLALGLGLRSCWSSPIVAADTESVLGVFALYYPEAYSPSEDDWGLVARLTHVAALAVGRHRTMEQLAHQAIHDPLTGAANRTLVCDRLGHALDRLKRQRSSVAVLFLDLDRFKALNDRYGHDAGDAVLIELTRRLQAAVRPSDTVARLGGDEFVVLCEGVIGELEVVGIADRIAHAVAAPFLVDDKEVSLTASIGIAVPRGDENPDSLLEQADAAMYQAKERGKARYQLFDTAMHERALRRLQTEEALGRALRQGELKLMYQPLVALEGEQVVAVEALLRWDHPERGLLGPDEFLGVAEDSGLIVPIGAWVIEEACRQAARWGHGGDRGKLKVHVNVSGRQLRLRELPELVRTALYESGADPSAICLEITETRLDGRRPDRSARPPGAQGAGRALEHRRLRHGLLLPHLRRLVPHRRAEDRSVLHRRRGRGRRAAGCPRRGQPGPRPRPRSRGRRSRESRAGRPAAADGMRHCPGLLLEPAAPGGRRGTAVTARPPTTARRGNARSLRICSPRPIPASPSVCPSIHPGDGPVLDDGARRAPDVAGGVRVVGT